MGGSELNLLTAMDPWLAGQSEVFPLSAAVEAGQRESQTHGCLRRKCPEPMQAAASSASPVGRREGLVDHCESFDDNQQVS